MHGRIVGIGQIKQVPVLHRDQLGIIDRCLSAQAIGSCNSPIRHAEVAFKILSAELATAIVHTGSPVTAAVSAVRIKYKFIGGGYCTHAGIGATIRIVVFHPAPTAAAPFTHEISSGYGKAVGIQFSIELIGMRELLLETLFIRGDHHDRAGTATVHDLDGDIAGPAGLFIYCLAFHKIDHGELHPCPFLRTGYIEIRGDIFTPVVFRCIDGLWTGIIQCRIYIVSPDLGTIADQLHIVIHSRTQPAIVKLCTGFTHA